MSSAGVTIQDMYLIVTNKSTTKKFSVDSILPFVIVPLMLIISTLSYIVTIVAMVMIAMGALYVVSRPEKSNRSPFFFYWTVSSFVWLLLIYVFEVIATLLVELIENVILLVLVACTVYTFYKMRAVADQELSSKGKEYSPMLTSDSKYCPICQIEVNERFFHSIWFNCCVFRPNYIYFLIGHIFALVTLLYCVDIAFFLVCHGNGLGLRLMLEHELCMDSYDMFQDSVTYVSSMYACGYILVITFVLLRQFFVYLPKYMMYQWKTRQT